MRWSHVWHLGIKEFYSLGRDPVLLVLIVVSGGLARYGADEFLIVMPEIADPEQPAQLAEQILDDFVAPFLISGHELPATPSLGIAVFPDDGEDYDTLLKKAQSATFYAKQAGRNRYRVFDLLTDAATGDGAAGGGLRRG